MPKQTPPPFVSGANSRWCHGHITWLLVLPEWDLAFEKMLLCFWPAFVAKKTGIPKKRHLYVRLYVSKWNQLPSSSYSSHEPIPNCCRHQNMSPAMSPWVSVGIWICPFPVSGPSAKEFMLIMPSMPKKEPPRCSAERKRGTCFESRGSLFCFALGGFPSKPKTKVPVFPWSRFPAILVMLGTCSPVSMDLSWKELGT